MDGRSMRRFWDARAREDPFFFVDNRLSYRDPDLTRFWAGGEELLEAGLERMEARIEPDDEIVEIGCGLGRMTRALAQRGGSVRAVDVSAAMLSRARELNGHLEDVTWVLGDGVSLSAIEPDSADVCYSDVVFQHIPDPSITFGYVREMGRVLRTGGWAGFQVSNQPLVHRTPAGTRKRVTSLFNSTVGRSPRGQSHAAWLGSSIDLGELERAAAEAGLRLDRVTGEGTQFCHVKLTRAPATGR